MTHASPSARTLDGEVCGENLAYAGGMFSPGEEGNFTKKMFQKQKKNLQFDFKELKLIVNLACQL